MKINYYNLIIPACLYLIANYLGFRLAENIFFEISNQTLRPPLLNLIHILVSLSAGSLLGKPVYKSLKLVSEAKAIKFPIQLLLVIPLSVLLGYAFFWLWLIFFIS
jgi:hypothetical protein